MNRTADTNEITNPQLKSLAALLLASGEICAVETYESTDFIDVIVAVGGDEEPLHIALDGFGGIEWQDFSHRTPLGNTPEGAADMIRLILKHPPGTFTKGTRARAWPK